MHTDQRSLTSAANGRKSQGPVSEAGKLRSSQNAVRHGLLSRCLVLEEESAPAFQDLLARHVERFRPVDEVELGLVEEMVAAMWRLRRSWAVETHLLDTGSGESAPPLHRIMNAFLGRAESGALPLAHRYETRLHLIYQRSLRTLLLLRESVPGPDEVPAGPIKPPSAALSLDREQPDRENKNTGEEKREENQSLQQLPGPADSRDQEPPEAPAQEGCEEQRGEGNAAVPDCG